MKSMFSFSKNTRGALLNACPAYGASVRVKLKNNLNHSLKSSSTSSVIEDGNQLPNF